MASSAANFARSLPLAAVVSLVALPSFYLSPLGVILAVVSGAFTSGLGYALWYAALQDLSATQAAMVQLTVPGLAALGGVLFLDETLSLRLVIASLAILGGIGLAALGRRRGR